MTAWKNASGNPYSFRTAWEELNGRNIGDFFHQRGWNDLNWVLAASASLETDDGCVADLAAKLEPVLVDYRHPGTGCIGNGLHLLLGEPGGWVNPSVNKFARSLILGAVRIGVERVVALLLEWVRGEPLQYRINVLVQGAEIDEPIHLPEGIDLWKLPNSSGDLPASLPFSVLTEKISVGDFMGGVVLSFDCEMEPALYVPDDNEVSESLPRNGNVKIASDRVSNFHVSYFLRVDVAGLQRLYRLVFSVAGCWRSGGLCRYSKLGQFQISPACSQNEDYAGPIWKRH